MHGILTHMRRELASLLAIFAALATSAACFSWLWPHSQLSPQNSVQWALGLGGLAFVALYLHVSYTLYHLWYRPLIPWGMSALIALLMIGALMDALIHTIVGWWWRFVFMLAWLHDRWRDWYCERTGQDRNHKQDA